MSKKNILVVCPGPICPITMGSQVRMYNLIKGLSKDHHVDVVARVPGKKYLNTKFTEEINKICNNYFTIFAPNKKSIFNRIYFKFFKKIKSLPDVLFFNSIPSMINQISQIVNKKRYDIINCEYWYSCSFYKKLNYKPYLALDTHDINFEKYSKHLDSKKDKKEKKLQHYKNLELKYTGLNDLIISVSHHDYLFFKKLFPNKTHLKIPIGQYLERFLSFENDDNKIKKNTILFYGSMSSDQNKSAFFRLFEKILPIIKKKLNEVKLIILGSNPSDEIKRLHDGKNIIVTGFVDDVREWIAVSDVLMLPLNIAGGFRTRVVEVMAMGVPVIGTHNALDCIEMTSGVNGFVSDNDEEMANYAIKLLEHPKLRDKMSKECKKFVAKKYSIEATYGKLSEFYSNLEL